MTRAETRRLKRKILKSIFERRLRNWYKMPFDEKVDCVKKVNTIIVLGHKFNQYVIVTKDNANNTFIYFYSEHDKMFSYVTIV